MTFFPLRRIAFDRGIRETRFLPTRKCEPERLNVRTDCSSEVYIVIPTFLPRFAIGVKMQNARSFSEIRVAPLWSARIRTVVAVLADSILSAFFVRHSMLPPLRLHLTQQDSLLIFKMCLRLDLLVRRSCGSLERVAPPSDAALLLPLPRISSACSEDATHNS